MGIDPGLKGGISGLDSESQKLWAVPTPLVVLPNGKNEYNIRLITKLIREFQPDMVCIEAVHSMPGQGVASTFLFGKGFGILLGIVGALGIPIVQVAPQTWKKRYSVTADKDTSRLKADELYPTCSAFWKLKKHDGLAEAAILAHYLYDGPPLDAISVGDISGLYSIGDFLLDVRQSAPPAGRHSDRSTGRKKRGARKSPSKRRDSSKD